MIPQKQPLKKNIFSVYWINGYGRLRLSPCRITDGGVSMREKIVLIDGHSILNRAFYGVPDLTNSEGLHTNAVYGFLNIMFKILDEEQPEYLTVTFDVHAPTFRHKMYADYKGTRKPMAEELRQQVPVIKEVLRAMDIEIIEKEGLEADDLLGTISHMCEEKRDGCIHHIRRPGYASACDRACEDPYPEDEAGQDRG